MFHSELRANKLAPSVKMGGAGAGTAGTTAGALFVGAGAGATEL